MTAGQGNRLAVSLAHGKIAETDAAEMQEAAVLKPVGLKLFRLHQHIGARIAEKAELTVAVRLEGDKGQRGVGLCRSGNQRRIHPDRLQFIDNLIAEGILA